MSAACSCFYSAWHWYHSRYKHAKAHCCVPFPFLFKKIDLRRQVAMHRAPSPLQLSVEGAWALIKPSCWRKWDLFTEAGWVQLACSSKKKWMARLVSLNFYCTDRKQGNLAAACIPQSWLYWSAGDAVARRFSPKADAMTKSVRIH